MPTLEEEREKANQLNEEGRETLTNLKGAEQLAKSASLREREATQKGSRANKVKEAAKGKAASLAGAKDAYQTAREFRKIQKAGLSKEGVAAARRAAVAAAWSALDQGARALAAETAGLSIVAYQALRHWRITIAVIIILFLFFFMMFDNTVFDVPNNNVPTTSDNCVPAQFTNQDAFGKTSVCTISVTYDGSAQDITITDTVLPGTAFVSADHNGMYDKTSGTVTWDAQKLNLPLDPVNITVTVTVRINTHQNNTTVYNAYNINPIGLTSGTSTGTGAVGGNVPANSSTCNGKYVLTSPLKNFGDPQCNFTQQQLGQQLKSLDPSHALIWDCMASHESGYNPNAYNPASTSGNGAYGLFQMNPPGKGNGKYDDGGVNWPLQISNAINYNKQINGSFAYWATYAGCH